MIYKVIFKIIKYLIYYFEKDKIYWYKIPNKTKKE